MTEIDPGKVISTILKHDAKVTSYKIALLRAINDVVLSFPDLQTFNQDVAVPLRELARFWIAYYWPFVERDAPILQGPRSMRGDKLINDMAFRDELTAFRAEWEKAWGGLSRSSDGFLAINELWNLVPSDRDFNQHKKRNRLPGLERLRTAEPILAHTYDMYALTAPLAEALVEDVAMRFATVDLQMTGFADEVAKVTVRFIEQVAESRNIARF